MNKRWGFWFDGLRSMAVAMAMAMAMAMAAMLTLPANTANAATAAQPPGAPAGTAAVATRGLPAEAPRTITMRFHDVELREVIDILSRHWRINILLSKGVAGRVSVNLFDVDAAQAVQAVAHAAGYAVDTRRGDYLILDRQELGRDTPSTTTTVRTYKVQYSNVRQVAELVGKYVSRYGKVTTLPERNLLIVEDAPDFHERIERLLATIDAEPRQILIEAKILEITLDDGETYGVDWSRIFGPGSASSTGTNGLAAPGTAGFFFNLVNRNLNVYLSALSGAGRVKTLSTPKLLALENQEAQAVIGERIGYKVTTTTNQVTTESVQFLETGVILKVTPSVDQRGRILMSIHPEISSATMTGGIPSKKSTEVTTQLLCEDGQAVFIGGLIKRVSSQRRSGVPLLKDLPAVGGLFSSTEESSASTETVVVITPRIVRSPAEPGTTPRVAPEPVPAPVPGRGTVREGGSVATEAAGAELADDERRWFDKAAARLRRERS